MSITLSPELSARILARLPESGFASPDAMVSSALAVWEQQQVPPGIERQHLIQLLEEGLADLRAGRFVDGPEAFRELRATLPTGA